MSEIVLSGARVRWLAAASLALAAAGSAVVVGSSPAWGRGDKRASPPPVEWSAPPAPARDRWLPWNPIPITTGITGFWGTAPDDLWAWGGLEVMHWDGRAWSRSDAPVGLEITAMWGKRRDVWLRASHFTPEWHGGDVIDGATFATSLLHFDGVAWTTVENRHTDVGQADLVLDGTLAPAPDKTKAVDRDELATLWKQHGDGRAMPAFTRGYRAGGGEIWAIDAEGRQVGHLDRAGWTVGGRLASGNFGAVRMIGAADGWAATRRAWDHSGGSNDQHLGGPAGDALFRWDGRAWRLVRDLPERVHAMWASGADDVWAVGEKGLVMHWDGARWSEQRLTGEFRAIWGRARDDIWINGCANNFYHWNGTAWRRVPNPVPDTHWGVCPVLWGASATDVSAIGYDRSLRWNGVAWTYGPNPFKEAGGAPPHSDSSPRNDAWVAMGQHITALWGSPSGADLWAVGYEGVSPSTWGWVVVLRQNGGGWSRVPTPEIEANLMAIWGDRDDDVWAVGTKGLILHWDGTSWSKQESGVSVALTSVHGADGTVWIVGERGTILVRALGK